MIPFLRRVLAATVTIGLSAIAAGAQTDEDRIGTAFATADVNNDGGVNIDEFVAYFITVYRSIDSDGDGLIYSTDLVNVDPANFARADRDGDGGVSLQEAVADRMIIFFEADTNEDGVLTLREIRSYTPS